MTDSEKTTLELARQINELKGEVAKLRASVGTLKACVVALLTREHPEEVLGQLEQWEQMFLQADPTELTRTKVLDMIEAFQALQKRGSSGPDS